MASVLPTKSFARIPVIFDLPDLIEVQLDSFRRLKSEGLADLFNEVSPIESYNKGMKLFFPSHSPESQQWGLRYWFGDPKHSMNECVERDLTYASPLYVSVLLAGPEVPEPIKQDIFLGDFPEMTEKGTFIINGSERVVVSQLIRSPGVYFEAPVDRASGHRLAMAKLIPDRGAWMEFETRKNDYLILKFNRKRTVPITIFLRALAAISDGLIDSPIKEGSDEELIALFQDVDNNPDRLFITSTLRQEPAWDLSGGLTVAEAALIEFFKRMRPGDPATLDNARQFLEEQLFDQRHYDLERVGRYKLNQKLDLVDRVPISHRTITRWDIVYLIRRMILINNEVEDKDDIDHLGNRRVKTVGELIQNKLRIGLRRMERVIKERMSIRDQEQVSPVGLVNIRPVVAALREFFGSSQLSQFMDQTNPLAELRHKRTLSALGPGGLRRERAGFDVRDVHHSHYGRICPIETPEGPNIGLIGRLANFARVNEYGFIETPYRRVIKQLYNDDARMVDRLLKEAVANPETGEVIAQSGERVTAALAAEIKKLPRRLVFVAPFVSEEVEYLSADAEDKFVIAQANTLLDTHNEFVNAQISCRHHSDFITSTPDAANYMDIAPHQVVGVSAALIPFLEHDDANRALMGSNMQAQAVPLVKPDIPLISTGMEAFAAIDSGQVVVAEEDGDVVSVTGRQVIVRSLDGTLKTYSLRKYQRSNQSTCIDQRPAVAKGQRVHKGDVLADSSSTSSGHLALGQNVVVAFVSWEGGNFEDAILISERLVQDDRFTSVHIEKYEVEARDTRLGPEEITRDIPNVGEDAIKDLDDHGIIRIGAEVGPNDILVGKITPKGEKELTPEERLLRAIFGEKSRDVKDTSLRMPHGERGKVVDVKVFTREDNVDLSAGVDMMVRVSVAQRRKITAGDKMAGRHGNKGVVSRVVAVEDMPFLEDGTPVDIILNPLGVPGRMNIGQVLEVHLGWAAKKLGYRSVTPVFDGANETEIEAELARAWLTDVAWQEIGLRAWDWLHAQGEYDPDLIRDDDEVRLMYLEDWLGAQGYDVARMPTDGDYTRRSVSAAWLREKGFNADEILDYDSVPANAPFTRDSDLRAINVSLRLWLERLGVDVSAVKDEEIRARAEAYTAETGTPMPILGKEVLRDGKSGIPYDQPVTVGVMTMLKLHHLVEDKVHARSTGPYSLVTQQPLGGKAQFGGQRFGEMEVWALEAYGAAYTLQEMLTVKSDDVQGRVNTYEAIVKGEAIEEPGLPASFRVLVKELQSLGLSVEAVMDSGDVIRFGKDEERTRPPKIETGLLGLGEDLENLI
ncbi:DNA-directed RNA polymerase subunit beta [Levilinea saccharolytica]|uniref:DNA-directed RNA polymerase subunit beta n=1 Tax=Levilinea saccharolytica TaxID=229921 RepID=A0A0P6XJ82_9CHLR|nr:DNA-directed RNA polymerase subunit beta [Levilinea saccharolytica]KPL83620.1 DNA-directed RNA polymerase subunit beta [Levilinea saccharolytica]GAP18671.1 DNA-directed RNA polymerase subunit beta [Levilinea saccharolytica]